ncbi:DUF4845 domain-containing protein [Nitrosomonas sp. wSCUT-2]
MEYYATLRKQSGMSLSDLLLWSVVIVVLAISALRVAPAYFEYYSIKRNLSAIMKETDPQAPELQQIRMSFAKRATVDNIKSISAQDIQMKKENGRIILSAKYTAKMPLVANISLHIDFQAESD